MEAKFIYKIWVKPQFFQKYLKKKYIKIILGLKVLFQEIVECCKSL